MKKSAILVVAALFALPVFSQKKKKDKEKDEVMISRIATPPPSLPASAMTNGSDSLSYAFGVSMANNMKSQGVETLNFDVFSQAVKETFEKNGKMSTEQANAYLKDFFAAIKMKQDEATRKIGEQFLEENRKKPGVITLPSGLQYKVLTAGTSNQHPTITDKVTTHYHGTLIDGTVFDSSVDRAKPATFPVSQVIRGWVEALQLMQVGDKWELYIPYDLAYGNRGQGKFIKPYSTLVFQVELLSIDK
jgi:FKBP-type peptidyl-prolyl cis-trans isomerase FklB